MYSLLRVSLFAMLTASICLHLYSALNIHCNTNINICRHRTNDGLLLEELLFAFATKLNQLCARLQFILSNLFNDIFPIDLNVNGS